MCFGLAYVKVNKSVDNFVYKKKLFGIKMAIFAIDITFLLINQN